MCSTGVTDQATYVKNKKCPVRERLFHIPTRLLWIKCTWGRFLRIFSWYWVEIDNTQTQTNEHACTWLRGKPCNLLPMFNNLPIWYQIRILLGKYQRMACPPILIAPCPLHSFPQMAGSWVFSLNLPHTIPIHLSVFHSCSLFALVLQQW